MKKLLLASPLAGVGKTTAALNLAAAGAAAGGRILLADCDRAGGAIAALGLGPAQTTLATNEIASSAPLWRDVVPGLDVTTPYGDPEKPAHTLDEFLELIGREPGFDRYFALLFDTPSVLAASQMSALLQAADDAILVIRPERDVLRDVHPFLQSVKRAHDEGSNIQFRGLLLTLPEGEPVGGSRETELRRTFTMTLLPHVIPYDPEVARTAARCLPVVVASPNSPAARQYTALAQLLGLAQTEGEAVDLFPPVESTAVAEPRRERRTNPASARRRTAIKGRIAASDSASTTRPAR